MSCVPRAGTGPTMPHDRTHDGVSLALDSDAHQHPPLIITQVTGVILSFTFIQFFYEYLSCGDPMDCMCFGGECVFWRRVCFRGECVLEESVRFGGECVCFRGECVLEESVFWGVCFGGECVLGSVFWRRVCFGGDGVF